MAATKGSRKADGRRKGEAYTLQSLSSAVGDAVKSLGEALSTAARKG